MSDGALQGQIAVVTGGAIGIGRGMAELFAAQGADVAILDRDEANNAETARLVAETGQRSLAITCDVGDATQVGAAFDRIVTELGPVTLLVNNAAVWSDNGLTSGDYASQTAAFADAMDSCVTATFNCAAAAVPSMRNAGGGNIVNILTEHVKDGYLITGLPQTGYDCAKFGQLRLTETWAIELAPHNIRVNALCMGATDTPMLRGFSPTKADAAMKPADVAQAVLNVVAHGSSGPTGQSYLFGVSGNSRDQSLVEIAALAP